MSRTLMDEIYKLRAEVAELSRRATTQKPEDTTQADHTTLVKDAELSRVMEENERMRDVLTQVAEYLRAKGKSQHKHPLTTFEKIMLDRIDSLKPHAPGKESR